MDPIERIPPEDAFEEVSSGEALLVCAYEDEEKCRALHIDDAVTARELERMFPLLPRDRELIFYCA